MRLFKRNLARCGFDVVIEERDEDIISGKTTELFTNAVAVRALVKTLKGVTVFDNTNTERVATHELCIAFPVETVTAENWVTLKGKRLKILNVVNCGECDEILKLFCTERGEDSKVVNRA